MEPATHLLTGACLSRSGLNRRAAYATLAMVIGAEFPDIDTLWSLRGPVASFQHHRGITHTFVGVPFEATLIVALIYLLHRWRHSRTKPDSRKPLTAAPVRWGMLYLLTLVALLSHLLLDFTNNYGLRPFYPFNPRWYAASIVFIFDPLIFTLLLAALVLPAIFRLVGSEVGARRQPFAPRGWAIAALALILAIWSFREVEHQHAVQLAMAQSIPQPRQQLVSAELASPDTPPPDPTPIYLSAQRVLASPDPLSPFRWYTATDFGPVYQTEEVNTSLNTVVASDLRQPKLNPSPALLAAEGSPLGRAYLDWSSMPWIDVDPGSATDLLTVTFTDPRFMGNTLLLHATGRVPITGVVTLDRNNRILRQTLDGKVQR